MRHPGDAASRNSPTRTWVADPPPFGVASDRFAQEGAKNGPEYHVAYRDVTQPPRWTAKGWVGMDDYIKPRRGTAPSVYGTSSLVPPTAPPRHGTGLASLAAPCPNEARLQELLNLQRRRVNTEPGPGAYEPRDVRQHRRFRRQQDPSVDGPFFLEQLPGGASTRSKEIAALFKTQADSGLGPGEYDGPVRKDFVMRSAPTYKLSTSDREGRTPQVKSLSISRSIQNGIDWHVPVIIQTVPAPAATAGANASASRGGSAGSGDAGTRPSSVGTPGAAGSTTRPSTAERSLASYGSSREDSPSGGSGGGSEQLLGVPPAPPPHVSRAVRREQQRRPGDWDWNRLAQNYRTSWTTLHGGAYSQGDHSAPRALPSSPSSAVSPSQAASQQPSLVQGIYPIQEESSGALERDMSAGTPGRQQQPPQMPSQSTFQQAYAPAAPAGPGGGGGQQPYYTTSVGPGDGAPDGGAQGVGATGRAHVMVSEEDIRRRRAAAELAERALQANTRVADWQSKFAG